MKIIIFTFLLSFSLFAYQKGSYVETEIQKRLNLSKDRTYIINFFASWCEACEREFSHLSKISSNLDKSGVEIIGVDVDEDLKDAKAFQKKLKSAGKLNFKVVDDLTNEIVNRFNPTGIPAIYFIQNGKVDSFIFGAKDNIDKLILTKLKSLK